MKNSALPAVPVDAEFMEAAESVLRDGESLADFVEATVQREIERRRIQTAFEARARESLQQYKCTGASHSVDEVFDELAAKIKARRAQIVGE